MVLVPPGSAGLKFWRSVAQPFDPRTADAWNVEDKSTSVMLSNSDKTATVTTGISSGVRSTRQRTSGNPGGFYAEIVLAIAGTFNCGIKSAQSVITNPSTEVIRVSSSTGSIFRGNTNVGGVGSSLSTGDVVCLSWDSGVKLIWFRKNNGLWNNDVAADPATGTNGIDVSTFPDVAFCSWALLQNVNDNCILHTEIADFTYSVPSGFASWMGEVVLLPEVTGTGELAIDAAAVSGEGDVNSAETTGTGAIAADAAVVSGVGISASSGAGTLAAQDTAASGTGAVASTGTGVLAAQSSTVAGAGLSVAAGIGALQAAAAAVVGAGTSASTGTGSLVAGSAEVAGTGTPAAANSGALTAQAATVAGLGVSSSTGSGALQAGAATVAGAGLAASAGSGDLVAGSATITGTGEVIAAGAAVGSGALVAGAAALSGEGEVTGEVVQPPVSVGGGYWRWPQRRPVAVEGIGYAILPQLEGEAHGLVGTDADGIATLSGVVGAGAGAVGVIGRSAARLAVTVAAIADSGPAGLGAGVITLKGAAIGRHDDDEAAMIALLVAA
jgi:hypothetical protein